MKACWILLGGCVCALGFEQTWIERYAQESAAASKSCSVKDYGTCREHLLRLLELLDGRADIVYRLAKVEASLGNQKAALEQLETFSKSGLTFADPATDAHFAALKSSDEFKATNARVKTAREHVTGNKLFLTLPDKDLIAEDIAHDPVSDRFFVSSVRHRKILVVRRDGKATDFVKEGQPNIWAVLALRVDSKRRILWATTAAMPESLGYQKSEDGRSALLKYSLDDGKLLKRYDLDTDTKHALGDMTVSSAGDVYVSDGFGAVYWVDHQKDELGTLIGKGVFRSPQTPALSPDEHRLFVPDYSRGISAVDLASKQVKLLEHPKELSLGGIDGLYLKDRTMIAVQNGTVPPRLIRMTLDDSLNRIVDWKIIESNWEGLGQPTHGVLVGDTFYFIADSGWDRLGDDGAVKPGATFESPTIRTRSFVP
jgi:hypothetical protein